MPLRKLTILIPLCLLVLLPAVGLTAQTTTPNIDLTPPVLGDFDEETIADIALEDYPVVPELTAHARQVYLAGEALGRSTHIFSKIGDCMTASPDFLTPFGLEDYALGEYDTLQAVVDYFAGTPVRETDEEAPDADSFANRSLASTSGFNTASVRDSLWANPKWCEPGESPLLCEYRVSNPAFAVIMFGTNDVFFTDVGLFDYNMRMIVLETLEAGVVPMLSTFPSRPEHPERSLLLNQIIVGIAQDYDLPLINLWLALQDLPNGGVDREETIHLTVPEGVSTGVFTEATLQAGYTMRNLVTLQAFESLLRDLEALDDSTDETE